MHTAFSTGACLKKIERYGDVLPAHLQVGFRCCLPLRASSSMLGEKLDRGTAKLVARIVSGPDVIGLL